MLDSEVLLRVRTALDAQLKSTDTARSNEVIGQRHSQDWPRSEYQVSPGAIRNTTSVMFPADRESHIAIHDHNGNTVSRNHCEVYAIVYEQDISHVYVRDRRSVNGTFVNGKLVGIGPDISPGYLLEDGDVIEIKPHWKFRFRHHSKKMEASLTDRQMQEAEVTAGPNLVLTS